MAALDTFFNLGNKVTKGDPLRKAQFDYYLYWIVFLSFLFIALNDYYYFFFKGAGLNTLFWGLIITIFGWFNYFALSAFRGVYENMKKLKKITVDNKEDSKKDVESVSDMLDEFKEIKGKSKN